MAHKKAAWSAKNLRDSKPKYRWVKVFWWQNVLAWNIILRQKWTKYQVGKNTYMWKDFSIHAAIDGVVEFSKANISKFDGRKYLKTFVNVVSSSFIEKNKWLEKREIKKDIKKETEKETKDQAVIKKETTKRPTITKKPSITTPKVVKKTDVAKKTVSTKKVTTTKKADTKKVASTQKTNTAKKTTSTKKATTTKKPTTKKLSK